MVKRFLFAVSLLALMTLASCIPEAEFSLSDIRDAKFDTRLVGLWEFKGGENDEGSIYLHVGAEVEKPFKAGAKEPERGLMHFVWIEHGGTKKRPTLGNPLSGRFFVSKIGDDCYVNVVAPLDVGSPPDAPAKTSYAFMKYDVEGDQLSLALANVELFDKAFKKGDLAGEVTRDRNITLTGNREQFTAFLQTDAGKKLFADDDRGKLKFRRLR